MQGDLVGSLQTFAPMAASSMIFAALILLWRSSRSIWLVVAMVAELVSLTFLFILKLVPALAQNIPIFFPVWTLSSLAMAIALLAYAIESTQRPEP